MSKKSIESIFDLDELKSQINQIKEAKQKAEKEQENKNPNGENKQSIGQKILGIIILLAVVASVVWVVLSSLDTLLLPKNSITIVVTDQDGNYIDNLKITLRTDSETYDITDAANNTILNAHPGDYMLTFDTIPEGYTCPEVTDSFTLNQDGKVKLEYECIKED